MTTHSLDIRLADYDVSPITGFMPQQSPLLHLENTYYGPWEAVVSSLGRYLETGQLGSEIDRLPRLQTKRLSTEPEWQRAYVILSFLAQGYIWEQQKPRSALPLCIANPLVEVADHLEITPCVTYAAVCLWNLRQESSSRYCRCCIAPESFSATQTFTGSEDEEWFYAVSAAIEIQGAGIIPQILVAADAARQDNVSIVEQFLTELGSTITDVSKTLHRMYVKCQPDVFYHKIRPFLAGSRNAASAGLPNGVYYPGSGDKGTWRKYYGGSNAQSTLIQLFDIVLGVVHTGSDGQDKTHYLQEVRDYMPGKHRKFLIAMEGICNFRSYATSYGKGSVIWTAYEKAVLALSELRNTHLHIASRYIIVPASKYRPSVLNPWRKTNKQERLKGTGGTDLTDFLRGTRDTTNKAARFEKPQ
ncbi:hypothetical protein FE257_008513 [Aspergillus nanangensis]|uniref:Indoleamine 2,3-dioxygenase n=1 Tax=Aspergillus nanangensis TaxID=2582783 RepID=A0AAD4GTF7_ASPNN|nr:hypothetical protein FE257_008513 [Aspergillus nanangensis]